MSYSFVLLMMIMMVVIMIIFDFIIMARLVVKLMLVAHGWIVIDLIQQTTRTRSSMCCGCDPWCAWIVSRCNMWQWVRSSQTFILIWCRNRHYICGVIFPVSYFFFYIATSYFWKTNKLIIHRTNCRTVIVFLNPLGFT